MAATRPHLKLATFAAAYCLFHACLVCCPGGARGCLQAPPAVKAVRLELVLATGRYERSHKDSTVSTAVYLRRLNSCRPEAASPAGTRLRACAAQYASPCLKPVRQSMSLRKGISGVEKGRSMRLHAVCSFSFSPNLIRSFHEPRGATLPEEPPRGGTTARQNTMAGAPCRCTFI